MAGRKIVLFKSPAARFFIVGPALYCKQDEITKSANTLCYINFKHSCKPKLIIHSDSTPENGKVYRTIIIKSATGKIHIHLQPAKTNKPKHNIAVLFGAGRNFRRYWHTKGLFLPVSLPLNKINGWKILYAKECRHAGGMGGLNWSLAVLAAPANISRIWWASAHQGTDIFRWIDVKAEELELPSDEAKSYMYFGPVHTWDFFKHVFPSFLRKAINANQPAVAR